MKQVFSEKGRIVVKDVPQPALEPGMVMVRSAYSCISKGTEFSIWKSSGHSLLKKAIKQPDKARKIMNMISTHGLAYTRALIELKQHELTPLGYSVAGTVIEVGAGSDELRTGDRVACAGSEYAYHAEYVRTPRNLTAPIPNGLDLRDASTATLGAVALQGVRRAQPTLGEFFVVFGLGIIGQITAQLLGIAGCRVIGIDLEIERIELATDLGMWAGVHPKKDDILKQVLSLTNGVGADGVIITASTSSSKPVSQAFSLCRKKGRVVLVGDVGLRLRREDLYNKEIDFLASCSYGPGRYDKRYEEKGIDYPLAYVRWTENRNMQEYLRLLAEGKVKIGPLIDSVHPVVDAGRAFQRLQDEHLKSPIVLLSYPSTLTPTEKDNWKPSCVSTVAVGKRRISLAVIGAGQFARSVHLPNINRMSRSIELRAVLCRRGHRAVSIATQFKAKYATTEFDKILEDPNVDAVLISTRHNLHGSMTLRALQAGKHVLVEKPLAIIPQELRDIETFYSNIDVQNSAPIVLTGFNRRFSPFAQQIHKVARHRSTPMIINYRVNAGLLPMDHWIQTEEGGGRNIGEACHIYDLFTYLIDGKSIRVTAESVGSETAYYRRNENFVATVRFADGSIGTLTYTALGTEAYPKECMEVYFDGKIFYVEDYKKLRLAGKRSVIVRRRVDKGHRNELDYFIEALLHGSESPIPLWQQIQAMEIAFEVERQLK